MMAGHINNNNNKLELTLIYNATDNDGKQF